MTDRIGGRLFWRPRIVRSLVAIALIACAGCSSASLDDIAPVAASRRPGSGPIDTGTYPNLNIAPKSAATPITPEEREQKLAGLEAAKARQAAQAGASIPEDRQNRLKLLGDRNNAEEGPVGTN